MGLRQRSEAKKQRDYDAVVERVGKLEVVVHSIKEQLRQGGDAGMLNKMLAAN